MSQLLNDNKPFLLMILDTSKDQASAIIDTITPNQVRVISEIVSNLLELPVSKETKSRLTSKQNLFMKLASKRASINAKRKLITKNYKHILLTLWTVKDQLKKLLT